jgi:hypothetical protein
MRNVLTRGISILNRNAAWRWKHGKMASLSYKALLDAAITGDGVFYCWWDPDQRNGQAFDGDIRTDVIDSTNLFVADVNSSDIQSQKYVMLSGRASVESLRREALAAGAHEADVAKIVADSILGDYGSLVVELASLVTGGIMLKGIIILVVGVVYTAGIVVRKFIKKNNITD